MIDGKLLDPGLGCSQHPGGGHDYGEPGTVGTVCAELEGTVMGGLRPPLERELGINKAAGSALPKPAPPSQPIPRAVPLYGAGVERLAVEESPGTGQSDWGSMGVGI